MLVQGKKPLQQDVSLSSLAHLFHQNNAIEGSHQRGIIVHSTHSSTVEDNVLYNVRGAAIYIEDGNEMNNKIKFNVIICPFPFRDNTYHGCTIPVSYNTDKCT